MTRTRFYNLHIPSGGNSTAPAEIVVQDGRITELAQSGADTAVTDERWVDLRGGLVLPGVIDCQVHLGRRQGPRRESFLSGTTAAAAGGVTCVVDMPDSSHPPVTTADVLRQKVETALPAARVDFMLWAGVSGREISSAGWEARLADVVDAGAAAVLTSLLSEFDAFPALPQRRLADVLRVTNRLGVPLAVRAEDESIVAELSERARSRGDDTLGSWAKTRPAAAEVAAVGAVLEVCRDVAGRVHFVDITAGEALDMISAARLEGMGVSAGTSLPFLAHDLDQLERLGPLLKTSPAVRSLVDRERIWQGLDASEIDLVASAHCPAVWPDEKRTGSVWTDAPGLPGVEILLPYLYSEGVGTGRMTLERLTETTSAAPARLLGIDHRKGRLAPGLDADFVVIDDHETWTLKAEDLHGASGYTPLEGLELAGRVRSTFVRGRCVFQRERDGSSLFAPEGGGSWVRRGTS